MFDVVEISVIFSLKLLSPFPKFVAYYEVTMNDHKHQMN